MMRSPSLRQLRAFRHVISLGSVSAAADALNLTQPALSKQIALLEEAVGLRLFSRRRGGPMIPTREAIAFYSSIEGTLFGLDAIPDIAKNIAGQVRNQLRIIATPPLINSQAFMSALAAFRSASSNVHISLASRQRVDLEDWVRSRQADIGLGLLPSRYPELSTVVLSTRDCVAVMAPDHPLSKRDQISVADLSCVTLILPSRQPLRDRIDAACPDLLCDIETSSSISCVGLAVSQNAVALCDPFSPTMYPKDFVAVRPLEPSIPLSYGAIVNKGMEPERAIASLLEKLRVSFLEE